ncbi:hypothetical protein ANCDUO_24783 [Ancylostoma duodenale]|uniref:Uncharacterized protein n=1 Tax=Ancylostoma duodenale TaxID=51022 RepID=A0A0C2F9P2_9BILA|nr:hypothetical protein ANCDUO_24783 [Ancylostoma duodenale]
MRFYSVPKIFMFTDVGCLDSGATHSEPKNGILLKRVSTPGDEKHRGVTNLEEGEEHLIRGKYTGHYHC